MAAKTVVGSRDIAVWGRVIHFADDPSPAAARELLKLQVSESDRQRMRELAAKARTGTLTPEEEQLTETYERLGCVLDILHSNSRRVLKRRRKPA